jgi:hypothetical protein
VFREKYKLSSSDKAVISVVTTLNARVFWILWSLHAGCRKCIFSVWVYQFEPCTKSIRTAIQNAPKNLSFPGYVERDELRDAYCGCDLFAFLSNEERRELCAGGARLRHPHTREGYSGSMKAAFRWEKRLQSNGLD